MLPTKELTRIYLLEIAKHAGNQITAQAPANVTANAAAHAASRKTTLTSGNPANQNAGHMAPATLPVQKDAQSIATLEN